jgi:hypothetical protein
MSLRSLVTQKIILDILDCKKKDVFNVLLKLPEELREIVLNYDVCLQRFICGDVEFYGFLGELTDEDKEKVMETIIRMDNLELFKDFISRYIQIENELDHIVRLAFIFNSREIIDYLFSLLKYFVNAKDGHKLSLEQNLNIIVDSLLYDKIDFTEYLYPRYVSNNEENISDLFFNDALIATIISRNFKYIEILRNAGGEYESDNENIVFENEVLTNHSQDTERKLLELLKPNNFSRLIDFASDSLVIAMLNDPRPLINEELFIGHFIATVNYEVLEALIKKRCTMFLEPYIAVYESDIDFFKNINLFEEEEEVFYIALDFAIKLDKIKIIELLIKQVNGTMKYPLPLGVNSLDFKSKEALQLVLLKLDYETKRELMQKYIENFEFLDLIIIYIEVSDALDTIIELYFYQTNIPHNKKMVSTNRWRYIYKHVIDKYERMMLLEPSLLEIAIKDVYAYIYLLEILLKTYEPEMLKIAYPRISCDYKEEEREEKCKINLFRINLEFNLKLLGYEVDDLFYPCM